MPDCPYLPNFRRLPRQIGSPCRNWLSILPKLAGNGLAVELVQVRLGVVQVQTWLGPPVMNRKMQRLAFGAK